MRNKGEHIEKRKANAARNFILASYLFYTLYKTHAGTFFRGIYLLMLLKSDMVIDITKVVSQ